MAGFVGHKMADNRHPQQKQIPDSIKYFMFNKFIRAAQTFLIENLSIIKNNSIFQRTAKGKAFCLHIFDFT